MSILKKGTVKLYSTSVLSKGRIKKVPISLIYETKGSKAIHIDITSLRPDPVLELNDAKKYDAMLEFDSILLPCSSAETRCMEIQILRSILVHRGKRFVNIR